MNLGNRNSDDWAWLVFKVNMLVLGLGIIIYSMYFLSQKGLPRPAANLLGISGGSQNISLNWCRTRVESLSLAGGQQIYQQGYKWFRDVNGKPVEMNFLSVEKWFAEYCRVDAIAIDPIEANQVLATVGFIDGQQEQLRGGPSGEFVWHGQAFRSDELQKGLQEAKKLR